MSARAKLVITLLTIDPSTPHPVRNRNEPHTMLQLDFYDIEGGITHTAHVGGFQGDTFTIEMVGELDG